MNKDNETQETPATTPTVVTEVQITPIRQHNGLVAFASCLVDGKIFIGGIGIYTKLDEQGYRLTYPNKKVNASSIKLACPITKEAGDAILNAITDEYERLLMKDVE